MYIPYLMIESDNQAEDVITEIQKANAEKDRLIEVCKYEIQKYQEKIADLESVYSGSIEKPMAMLGDYCRRMANHNTKTLASYRLPSGKLQWKFKKAKPVFDDVKLLEWVKANAPQFVKTKEAPAWAELKEALFENGDHYEMVTDDGEAIAVQGVTLDPSSEVFEIV